MEPKEIKPEFDFYADDVVTVRGPEKSFWVCRILEDVLETSNQINVAWFDMVEENKYKVFSTCSGLLQTSKMEYFVTIFKGSFKNYFRGGGEGGH